MTQLSFADEKGLLDYDLARSMGMARGNDRFDFKALAKALDCTKDFFHAGIIYDDGKCNYLVRPSQRYGNPGGSTVTHVVVTRVDKANTTSVAKSMQKAVSAPSLGTEITSTVLSCGAVLVTASVAIVGAGAAPITAGGSSFMVALGYAGAAASAVQCMNGMVRLYDISVNEGEVTSWLDSQDWYNATSTALDLVSLASAAGALKEAVATYRAMKAVSSLKARDWLKKYPRQDRARLTREIIRAENPNISNTQIKAAIRAGLYPKRFPSEPVQRELQKRLGDAVNSALALAGSGVSGVISSPGSVKHSGEYVIGLLQSILVLK